MGQGPSLSRRGWLRSAAALALPGSAGLAGCGRHRPVEGLALDTLPGGWVGAAADRGHRLRDGVPASGAPQARRCDVLIVGAGIAGLAAARALAAAGIDDLALLELEDRAGGNSRGHLIDGLACPLGAHYLPLPGEGPEAEPIVELLESLGLRRTEQGRPVYDERWLCHSPQERLFADGQWIEGLLPPADDDPALRTDYRRFARRVEAIGAALEFRMPTLAAPWTDAHAALDAEPFATWLDREGLQHPRLRWYLDYCCRDDYGAGVDQVSAWAGLHYFASRHGFHAPGDDSAPAEPVLTWPEGNGWLAARLAAPFASRLHTGRIVTAVRPGRESVEVDVQHANGGAPERWTARQLVLAVPLFIAERLLGSGPAAPDALRAVVPRLRHAPWLVANLALSRPLVDRGGTPPAWDNVILPGADDAWGAVSLGYVDAGHQRLDPTPGPTVLTAYWALGGGPAPQAAAWRRGLLDEPWQAWAARVVAQLAQAQPELPERVRRVDLMRWGHAMSVPVPGLRGSAALAALARPQGRLHFAHADLSAYSVFEEAYAHGLRAGRDVAAALRAAPPFS